MPMSIQEVIKLFEDASPEIFKDENCCTACCNGCCGICIPFPYYPHSQKGIESVLKEKFGEHTTLKQFNSPESNECIAAAVAKKYHYVPEGVFISFLSSLIRITAVMINMTQQ